jgi:hypothetical protein
LGGNEAPIWQHYAMARLLADEVDHYRSQGWVIPSFCLPAAQVALMASALDELLRDNPRVRPEKLVSAHIEGATAKGCAEVERFSTWRVTPGSSTW